MDKKRFKQRRRQNFEALRDIISAQIFKNLLNGLGGFADSIAKHNTVITKHDLQSVMRQGFMAKSQWFSDELVKMKHKGKVSSHLQRTVVRAAMNNAITKFLPALIESLENRGMNISD